MSDIDRAKALLASGAHSCVLCRGDDTLVSDAPGVAALVGWSEDGTDLRGYSAADRVAGRAAALLYAAAGVNAVYADVAGERAATIFAAHSISFEAGTEVPVIMNRDRTGLCPMEAAVADTDDPKVAVPLLRAAVESMRKAQR